MHKINLFNIKEKLDEVYWLINPNQEERKDAEKSPDINLSEATELLYSIIDFFEVNHSSIININDKLKDLLDDIETEKSKLESFCNDISDKTIINV